MKVISRADLVHDLADVLHQTRMSYLIDGALPIDGPTALPTRRDREQAEDIVARLIELRVFPDRGVRRADEAPPEVVAAAR
jgi:hypothetical protein